MSDMTHRVFFGDRERDFKITPKLIAELERQTGVGVGALCKRLFAGDFPMPISSRRSDLD